jgi:hypothetical protein
MLKSNFAIIVASCHNNCKGGLTKMSVAIRIDDELYRQAETTAKAESRTPPLQIQYWAKIGKTALENPDLPIEFIKSILASDGQPSEPFEFRLP